jgi:hypothetical protein
MKNTFSNFAPILTNDSAIEEKVLLAVKQTPKSYLQDKKLRASIESLAKSFFLITSKTISPGFNESKPQEGGQPSTRFNKRIAIQLGNKRRKKSESHEVKTRNGAALN